MSWVLRTVACSSHHFRDFEDTYLHLDFGPLRQVVDQFPQKYAIICHLYFPKQKNGGEGKVSIGTSELKKVALLGSTPKKNARWVESTATSATFGTAGRWKQHLQRSVAKHWGKDLGLFGHRPLGRNDGARFVGIKQKDTKWTDWRHWTIFQDRWWKYYNHFPNQKKARKNMYLKYLYALGRVIYHVHLDKFCWLIGWWKPPGNHLDETPEWTTFGDVFRDSRVGQLQWKSCFKFIVWTLLIVGITGMILIIWWYQRYNIWIILDAYAITSMPIKNMHCIIGVYADLQRIDAHSTYRMSYFEDDATYTFVIPCHPHIQAKTYFSSGCGGCHGLDSFQIRVRRPSHWAELCGQGQDGECFRFIGSPKLRNPQDPAKLATFHRVVWW